MTLKKDDYATTLPKYTGVNNTTQPSRPSPATAGVTLGAHSVFSDDVACHMT